MSALVLPTTEHDGFGDGDRLLRLADLLRRSADTRIDRDRRTKLGQFLTPSRTARLMVSMFEAREQELHLLDPGAGSGALTAAFVAEICSRPVLPKRISVTAYEIDPLLVPLLDETLRACRRLCETRSVPFSAQIIERDFIEAGVAAVRGDLFAPHGRDFTSVIVNPPYRKINTRSTHRQLLQRIDVETSHLYAGFLAIAIKLLRPHGEVVAITPRSFCNGPYFRPFRQRLIETVALRRIHVFDSRHSAFRENDVLQENVIFHATRSREAHTHVIISASSNPDDPNVVPRTIALDQVIRPDDPESFIHIAADENGLQSAERIEALPSTLTDLGLNVSTGRVVDFRASAYLRDQATADCAPLIYPSHCREGRVRWPQPAGRKPNGLLVCPATDPLLVPTGVYVLVRRFSAKEEPRRVMVAVFDPRDVPGERIGLENHLNYVHRHGSGLPRDLAMGLALFLNSTPVAAYVRQFNGHTQINATDLRNLRYPSQTALERLGAPVNQDWPDQATIDRLVKRELIA